MTACILGAAALLPVAPPAWALPALPAGWQHDTLEIGVKSSGPVAAMRAAAPFGVLYQYLTNDWVTWNSGGSYATQFIQEASASGMTPAFTYYAIYMTDTSGGEADAVLRNLNNTSLMSRYFQDLKLFFQKAGAFPNTKVLLHFEPDMWGYMQQRVGDDAASVPVKVAATGISELQLLPDNAVGLAQAVKKLRDAHAPNVLLGYHMNLWGAGIDLVYNKPSSSEVVARATRSADFFHSLATEFDLSFAEFSDRDAAFHQIINGRRDPFYTPADFDDHVLWLSTYSNLTGHRLVLWQIPLGNTKMRAMNNTWHHFQDNIVETLLDDPSRSRLEQYVDAGVVALLFGSGADGTTGATDAAGDGVTNPAPINGNDTASYNADDDGGFFKAKAKGYYGSGALPLPGGG